MLLKFRLLHVKSYGFFISGSLFLRERYLLLVGLKWWIGYLGLKLLEELKMFVW